MYQMNVRQKNVPKDDRFYQYTCIDEATRERYLYWNEEHTEKIQ